MVTGTTFIYALNDPITGLLRYIGKSDNPTSRLKDHLYSRHSKDRRGRWICSLLSQGLFPELQVLCETPRAAWQDTERKIIKAYRSLGFDLVNTTEGGDGVTQTVEIREKIGAAQRGVLNHNYGKKLSAETREKMSDARRGEKNCNFGKTFSDETRAKISASKRGKIAGMSGKRHTPDSRAKQRESALRRFARQKEATHGNNS